MKKIFLLLLASSFYSSYAQIRFEKGYFYNNENTKINCFIKNVDWLSNPSDIKYKLSENGEVSRAKIEEIKEFHVSEFTFKRFSVLIDRSGTELPNLSNERQPLYNEETVFLRELVKGETNLYSFLDGNLTLFFYKSNDQEIIPLVYKLYYKSSNVVGRNNGYKQQLVNDLKCDASLSKEIGRIEYETRKFIDFFQRYNTCKSGEEYEVKEKPVKKNHINLSIRPGITMNSFRIPNRGGITNPFPYEYDFGSTLGYQLGVEFEYIMPFNKNKWAIIVEALYNTFESESTSLNFNPTDVLLVYQTFEVPIGIRHYFFVGDRAKIFINASYALIFDLNSEFTPARNGFVFAKGTNQMIGLGFDFNNKFKIEARFDTSRGNIFPLSNNFVTEFSSYSIVLGCNLF
jgi:hypothetical protein